VKRVGPHSRTFDRGAIGSLFDGRSREGRFLRAFERQMIEHVGGTPTVAQRVLVGRLARVALRLELFYEKIAAGDPLTDHDGRVYNALHNSLRLMLRELETKKKTGRRQQSLTGAFADAVS